MAYHQDNIRQRARQALQGTWSFQTEGTKVLVRELDLIQASRRFEHLPSQTTQSTYTAQGSSHD